MDNGETLIIAIDESHVLTQEHLANNGTTENKKSLYQAFRGGLKNYLNSIKLVCIMTSTNSSIADYPITKQTYTSSTRNMASNVAYPSYSKVIMTDCLVPSEYTAKLDEFSKQYERENKATRLYDFLMKRKPFEGLFAYGRPLWFSLKSETDKILFYVASQKLINQQEWSKVSIWIKYFLNIFYLILLII
jgi:hypothetical protein